MWTVGCWQASLSGNTHTASHKLTCTTHCLLKHNIPWSFFTSSKSSSFHCLFIFASLEIRSVSVHAISFCSKCMTLCDYVIMCVRVCARPCSVRGHAYLPLGLRASLKMFVFMPCTGGFESSLHLCVCDTAMMRGWGIPGFLHEAADRCGRLESKLFCWPTSKRDFSPPLLVSFHSPFLCHFLMLWPAAHTAAEAAFKTWTLTNTRRR